MLDYKCVAVSSWWKAYTLDCDGPIIVIKVPFRFPCRYLNQSIHNFVRWYWWFMMMARVVQLAYLYEQPWWHELNTNCVHYVKFYDCFPILSELHVHYSHRRSSRIPPPVENILLSGADQDRICFYRCCCVAYTAFQQICQTYRAFRLSSVKPWVNICMETFPKLKEGIDYLSLLSLVLS